LQPGKLDTTPKSRFYSCRIQTQGRREPFPLRTANKSVAATRAAQIFGDVIALGWEAALAKHKPQTLEKPKAMATVGELVRAVAGVAEVRPVTMAGNAASFRRIMGDVLGIEAGGKSRFAPKGKGRTAWLEAVDRVPLSALTSDKVQAWKLAFVGKAGNDEAAARRARNSANSILRQARSLFGKKVLRFVSQTLVLPSPLPFDGVDLFPRQSMRYAGAMDVEALLTAARAELGGVKAKREEWKAFILCLFGGLRRNEADKLRWQCVDFTTSALRIEAAGDFSPKVESALGEVPIDAEVCAILRGLRAAESKAVYVLAGEASKPGASSRHYRANATFQNLTAWLRKHGVTDRKPLHTLRKEAGSLVCQRAGLFSASRFLRHADVAITAQHYAAQKERVTVGLGSLLSESASGKVLEFKAPRRTKRKNSA